MRTQTESGKAFEYALAIALYNKLNNGQKIKLEQNSQLVIAKRSFDTFAQQDRDDYNKAAVVAVDYVVKLEPRLEHPLTDNEIVILIQTDQKGESGDIRDVVTIRSDADWEIGFSAKNNHMAVKHSRLSDLIDFGKEWFGIPCSLQYMNEAKEIFGELRHLIEDNKKKEHVLLWREILDKKRDIYTKILDSFQKEMTRLVASNNNIPALLLRYLIGKHDFYKIMKFKNRTVIQGFNLYGTLNQSSNSVTPLMKIPRLKPPTKIDAYERKKTHTLLIRFDEGWQLSFRIHNASSKVEPSLKFDIQLTGVPSSLFIHSEFW
ncbi:MAG: HaeIII family restriction endonuclease [Candidatus Nitrosotenuis sp.]